MTGVRGRKSPPETAALGKTLDFMRGLWAVDHGLQRASKRMDRDLGVTGPQRLAIRILGLHPRISAGELARWMFIHPSTLTGVLRRLEQRRVIRRSADPEDGRRAIFELTPLGRRIEQQRGGTVEATVEKALASLSRAEIESATAVLAKLAREFERG